MALNTTNFGSIISTAQGEGAFSRHDLILCALGALLIAVVAAADYALSGRFAVSLGHATIVLLGLAARTTVVGLMLATLATLASAAVGAFGMQDNAGAPDLANRSMALVTIWVVAALVCYSRRSAQPENQTRELLDKNDIFQAVFNQTYQFVAALDPEGDIIEGNRTLRDYAGLTAGEIRSMPLWLLPIFQHDRAAAERLRAAVAAAAAGDFIRDEFVISGVGDQPTVIDLSLKPIREEGGSVRQIIMEARDITESRTQQQMLIQAQKMEAVGELTAGVAHDFNNLLTVIVGNLELLERRIEGNEQVHDRLRRAINAAFRGQALTQQLLAFSRRQSLHPAVIDVNTLLCSMSQLYESLGEGVRVEFKLSEGLPPCEVDPILLETALLNIAINARDAMPEGGVLRFHTGQATFEKVYHGTVSDLPAGDYVCIAVTDTGVGIPRAVLSQVFDPFFTTKAEGEGTGLGLSMVYGFVKQSGGDVKIYSEEGKGTTVRLYLPLTEKPLPQKAGAAGGEAAGSAAPSKTVLLVDDDEEVREVVLDALKGLGCQVETAESGDAAIALIRAGNTYDLVFTDMVMTGNAGGRDVARAARAATPGVPVIFCSGFPRETLGGEEAAFDGALFLAKPFHQDELVSVVERGFRRAETASSASGDVSKNG